MHPTSSVVLERLIVASHRLTRLAALATGSSTPAAVWRTLSILESDGPLRVGELATTSRISQPGMTKLLRDMVADGLARRVPVSGDARGSLIELTPAGSTALAAWRERLVHELEPRFADLGSDDWAALERTVALLATRTETAGVAA
jgi:DNA-binding MarR family transcriptional regulator